MKGNKKHGTHGSRLRLALLVLLVVTGSVMIGTSFAKYVISDEASDGARIPRFVIEATGNSSTDLKLDADAEKNFDSYAFAVTNTSDGVTCEVMTEYDIIVNLPKQLNGEIEMILMKDNQELVDPVVSEDGLTYLYDAGIFQAAQGETHNFELVFRADNGISEALDLSGIKISAYAEQVD